MAGGANGSWSTATSQGEYGLEKFFCESTDRHGHHSTVKANIPPTIHTQIATIVQGGKVPAYRTMQDLVRDAIFHRLQYLNEEILKDPKLARVISIEMRLSEQQRAQDELDAEERYVDGVEAQLRRAVKLEDADLLAEVIDSAEVAMADENFRLRSSLRKKLVALLDRYRKEAP